MPVYRCHGRVPQKRYTVLRGDDGQCRHEELLTNEGFDGETSLLYHLRAPTSVLRSEHIERPPSFEDAPTPLANHLLHVGRVHSEGDMSTSRRPLFVGETVSFSLARPESEPSGFLRNAWSDELVLIAAGSGTLRSAFGDLRYRALDLVHVPRSVTVQWLPDSIDHTVVVVESKAPIVIPPHFRNPRTGQFYEWAPYHERDLRGPEPVDAIDEQGEFAITIKRGEESSRIWLDHHPFDVVGWDGCLYPFALNLDDYEPMTGRVDKLPDQYQVFVTAGTQMMVIVPRRRADHPDALPAQPHHMNTDIDEILYRIGGANRDTDPAAGTLTLHPRGLSHGPRPGFFDQPKTDTLPLYAFMLDTRDHLRLTNHAIPALDTEAAASWVPKEQSLRT